MKQRISIMLLVLLLGVPQLATAQEWFPQDNGLATYHRHPHYRSSEEHPLRILGYILHPVGWIGRELVTRPISAFASSTEFTRSFWGYRDPYDYRQPDCFDADDTVPDCRAIAPFNYGSVTAPEDISGDAVIETAAAERQVYFPDVNFDFDKYALTDLGRGRAHQIAQLLEAAPNLQVILEGHTDYIGSVPYNDKLGLNRADTVRKELLELGVDPGRVSTVTFGKSQPIFSDETDWARAVNRRVTIEVADEVVADVESAS